MSKKPLQSEIELRLSSIEKCTSAVEAVRENVRKYAWVVDMDIKSFFDEVDHELMMQALDCHVEEHWVKLYVRRWLEAPVALKTGEHKIKAGRGIPKGGVIKSIAGKFVSSL